MTARAAALAKRDEPSRKRQKEFGVDELFHKVLD
jgi:hypothetical protein